MIKDNVINFSKGFVTSGNFDQNKDSVYRGEVGRVLVGEAVNKNDLLYPVITSLGTVAEWKQTNANASATMPALAIALEDCADGGQCKVMFSGYIKDEDFDYGTLASGTLTLSGTVTEGDKIVLGDALDPYCLMFTTAAGTSSLAKVAATGTLTTSGVAVANEIFTIDDVVFETTTDGVLTAGSHFNVDVSANLTQANLETAIEAALDQAIASKAIDLSYVAFAANDCVMTLGSSYVGLEQNDVVSTEGFTNASWGAVKFSGGCPAVNKEMAGTLTIAAAKVLLTAGIVWAIADGLDVTQAAWATNDLVITAGTDSHKGYKGNNICTAELNLAGTLDGGGNLSWAAAKLSGGVEGGILYTATSKGLLTLTSPVLNGVVQNVGYAVEADKFLFNPMGVLSDVRVPITMPTKGAGFLMTGSTNYAMQHTNDAGELVTDLYIDITGNTPAGNAARDAIGSAAASYIFQYTVAAFGYVYLTEFTCLELPAGGATITVDLDFEAETSGTIQKDGACSDEVLAASGTWTVGEKISYTSLLVADRYIYLTEGDTTADGAAAYTAGQFHIRMVGRVPAAF